MAPRLTAGRPLHGETARAHVSLRTASGALPRASANHIRKEEACASGDDRCEPTHRAQAVEIGAYQGVGDRRGDADRYELGRFDDGPYLT